ncbi:Hypothetical Protein FCC1311_017122 [Hondaea fermentalgiana]|uniref:Membrane transporter protein n=1 Tax=Hondaea fermentalgiana TaxID=2315210 RepID=A0A2R5GAB7_9STRA|nr:Hypothetical Protein FCC1311_017122 [Hondaea fermentalgiana]|eukprot:GBG25493.1 Hypothetical Protein FCC1311_017122 [Hondaea fermentalgiana]
MASIGGLGGMAGSFMGMGGGFVVIPLLTGLAKFTQHNAHATSLAAVAATSIGSSLSYYRNDALDFASALPMAAGALFTVRFGARYTKNFSSGALKRTQGALMLLAAPMVAFQADILRYLRSLRQPDEAAVSAVDAPKADIVDAEASEENDRDQAHVHSPAMLGGLLGLGGIVGFASGFLGIGGGVLMTAGLTMSTTFTHHTILGTSLAAMCLPSLLGTVEHYRLGHIQPRLALPVVVGTVVGSFIGGEIAIGIPEDQLKKGFGVVIGSLGLRALLL